MYAYRTLPMPISGLQISGDGRVPNEVDKVVETEKCFQAAVPRIAGAHTHFGLAKKRFFLIPEEERHKRTGPASFVAWWTGIMSDKSLLLPLQLFAVVVVLSCPSSCDAERAISVLNRTVTDLWGRMSWGSIRMHLIGAEAAKAEGCPYND